MGKFSGIPGLFDLYRSDPYQADRHLFGRETFADRRGFLKRAGLATMGAMVGAAIPFHRNTPAHFLPVALASQEVIHGKDGLTVLNEVPLNAETLPHLLDDEITPTHRHFVRNNGIPPERMSPDGWTLTIDGEVESPTQFSIDDLRQQFEIVTRALTLDCAGNGRAFFDPPVDGNQWTYGAVACSEWTGVRLADVLKATKLTDGARYTAHYSADTDVSGTAGRQPISRGIPIEKALDENNLIAFAQNGGPIHPMNGAPLRLVIPGWPGACSQKWLTRVWIRDRVHDGPKMTGRSYRVPSRPVAPGEKISESEFAIIHSMPIKSLITHPASGHRTEKRTLEVRGHAWAGDRTVAAIRLSLDFGATWVEAQLDGPANPYAWQNWRTTVKFPQSGYYEVWANATDSAGVRQPHAIAWNPGGYLNNSMHRIAVIIE